MIRIFFCTLLLTIGAVLPGIIFSATWETSTMRAPGGGLIRVGMTRQEVLKELGQPLGTRTVARSKTSGGKSGAKGSAWTYRGSDGLYTLSFSGEQVVKITVTPDRD
jgi:hypothetical protein